MCLLCHLCGSQRSALLSWVLCFHSVVPGDQTLVRFDKKHLYPLSNPTSPEVLSCCFLPSCPEKHQS